MKTTEIHFTEFEKKNMKRKTRRREGRRESGVNICVHKGQTIGKKFGNGNVGARN